MAVMEKAASHVEETIQYLIEHATWVDLIEMF